MFDFNSTMTLSFSTSLDVIQLSLGVKKVLRQGFLLLVSILQVLLQSGEVVSFVC